MRTPPKRFIALALLGCLPLAAQSETFIGVTTLQNRLLIPTNSAALFNSFLGTNRWGDRHVEFDVVKDGRVCHFNAYVYMFGHLPSALTGPAELRFTNAVVVNYQLVYGSAIHSVLVANGETSEVITIPEGKRLKLFKTLGYLDHATIQVTRGDVTIRHELGDGSEHPGGEEFTGPLAIRVSAGGAEPMVVSYFITDDFLKIPEFGLLQGPTGTFEIAVEKSVDLTNWFPVVVDRTESVQKEFFRLRLSR